MRRARTTCDALHPAGWCDANAEFAERSAYQDFDHDGRRGKPKHYPVIFELDANHTVADVRNLKFPIAVPAAYPDTTRFATAWLDRHQYKALGRTAWHGIVRRWALQMPVIALRPSVNLGSMVGTHPAPSTGPGPQPVLPNGSAQPRTNTVIGVIDTGCPFGDPRYLRKDQGAWRTRILALWDQTQGAFAGMANASVPADFDRGAELRAADIDAWLAACRAADGSLDEALCYRRAGYAMMGEGFVHGAAVLDLAAGPLPLRARYPSEQGGVQAPPPWYRDNPDPASEADIVFVQLARDAVEDSTSASFPMRVLDALRYIVRRAAGAAHVVVNLSDGTSRALHDGRSLLEAAIEDLLAEVHGPNGPQPPMTLDVVVAAGNAYSQARHAVLRPMPKPSPARVCGSDVAMLRLPVDNEEAAFLNIDIPPRKCHPRLRITPPAALRCAPFEVEPGQAVTWFLDSRPCLWVVMPPQGDHRTLGLAVWSPTATRADGRRSAPAGDWRIQCLGDEDVEWPLWISLAQNNVEGPASIRQARFTDADGSYDPQRWMRHVQIDPQVPASVIRRAGTLSVPATIQGNKHVRAVGATILRVPELPPSRYFEKEEGRRSPYSSIGPTLADPSRNGPADFAHAQPGIRGAGSPSGRVIAVTGTSFAAPQVARELANQGP